VLKPARPAPVTAVPAFIGYTQRAEVSGVPATNVPVRISSMMEYEQYFGRGVLDAAVPGRPLSPIFSFTPVETPSPRGAPADRNVSVARGTYDLANRAADAASTVYAKLTPRVPLHSLYNGLRLFYASGGGPVKESSRNS
jgi:hypothetical protein